MGPKIIHGQVRNTQHRVVISNMVKTCGQFFILICMLSLLGLLNAIPAQGKEAGPVCLLEIRGGIGPATTEFIEQGLKESRSKNAQLLLITMDTPGGLSAATRDIVQIILSASVPVATFVHPQGARAASAGTYILYSSHIAAMAPACTIGAATPVQLGGGGLTPGESGEKPNRESRRRTENGNSSEGEDTPAPDENKDSLLDDKKRKVVNDAVAFIRGLAEKRKRNADWAEKAVREAASIKTSEAKEKNVIDFVATSPAQLLEKLDGHKVDMNGSERTLHTAGSTILRIEPNWRTKFLNAITNPNLAYILLIVGIYGLLLEGYNPGAIVPGVVGAIALIIAFYALQILPVNFVGIGLIMIGAILMVSEAFVPSFGALGIGGIIALVLGGIFLINPDTPGFGVDPGLISAVGIATGLVFLGVTAYLVRARQKPVVSGRQGMIGSTGCAITDFGAGQGKVFIQGERWNARTTGVLRRDQAVRVTGMQGLTLWVEPAEKSEEAAERQKNIHADTAGSENHPPHD